MIIVIVDGKQSKTYDQVYGVIFSADSRRFGYVASSGSKKFVVVDDKEGKHYDHVAMLMFSPDGKHVAYRARSNDEKFVVVDGNEGKKYEDIIGPFDSTLVFSPDGMRVAYGISAYIKPTLSERDDPSSVDNNARQQFIVVDGQEGKRSYDEVSMPIFSPDSKRVAYQARSGNQKFVVVDGKEGKAYDEINHLAFSPDSKYLAYVAYSGKKYTVVVDGTESFAYTKSLTHYNLLHESKIVFDSANSLHYLAEIGKSVYLVQEKLVHK